MTPSRPAPPVRDRAEAIKAVLRGRIPIGVRLSTENQDFTLTEEWLMDTARQILDDIGQPDPEVGPEPVSDEESRLLGRLVDAEQRAERAEERLRAVEQAAREVAEADFSTAFGRDQRAAALQRLRAVLAEQESGGKGAAG